MARRVALLLVALALVLTACGGDDSKDASKTTTTTSAAETSSTTLPPVEAKTIAGPHALAAIVKQLDDPLRRNAATADPCIHGPRSQCVGDAKSAYTTLEDLGGAVTLLTDSVTKGSRLYIGELPDDLVGLYDSTIDAGTALKDASTEAQLACLPEPTGKCSAASKKLDAALIEIYKQYNAWRKLL